MKKNVTRKDIAKEAGVSVSVVSRALNNSGYVEKEKKRRVELQSVSCSVIHNHSSPLHKRTFSLFINAFSVLLRSRMGVSVPSASTMKISFISGE